MAFLILVRHSISVPDRDCASRDWLLSDFGREVCQLLAERLLEYQPDIFITSDEPKAIDTGKITSAHLDIPVFVQANLHEHERPGVPWYNSEDAFHAAVKQFFARPEELVFGQETATQALERFSRAIDDVLTSYLNQNVVIVTHGTVMSLYVAQCLGIDPFWRQLGMPAFVVLDLPDRSLIRVVERIPIDDIEDR
jgi:broad specificity phosphatase PhoE